MRLLRSLTAGLLARRTVRTLDRIETQLALQNALLSRLVDHFAPAPPATSDVKQTSVDFLNEQEAILVLDYAARVKDDTGREPTDDEILRYLADHATRDHFQEGATR